MTMSLRRNTDSRCRPAIRSRSSSSCRRTFAGGGVANVPGILMKSNEQARGTPLAGARRQGDRQLLPDRPVRRRRRRSATSSCSRSAPGSMFRSSTPTSAAPSSPREGHARRARLRRAFAAWSSKAAPTNFTPVARYAQSLDVVIERASRLSTIGVRRDGRAFTSPGLRLPYAGECGRLFTACRRQITSPATRRGCQRRLFLRGDAVLHRLLHLLEGAHLDLAHALARDAELRRRAPPA